MRCPECDRAPWTAHAIDCVLRPMVRYEDELAERYARGDGEVYRIAGAFMRISELIEIQT